LPPPHPAGLGVAPPPLPQQFEENVENTFFTFPVPHLAQVLPSDSALIPALYRSNESPQALHRYSYMGISVSFYFK